MIDPTSISFFETGNARFFEGVKFEREGNIRNVIFKKESAINSVRSLYLLLFKTVFFEGEPVIDGEQVSIPIVVQDTVSTLDNDV